MTTHSFCVPTKGQSQCSMLLIAEAQDVVMLMKPEQLTLRFGGNWGLNDCALSFLLSHCHMTLLA